MAAIRFFTKLGCSNGKKQRKLLTDAGHDVDVIDLLAQPWTAATLRPFFGNLRVDDWFNRAAPAVKSGALDPKTFTEETALAAMVAEPLLIRRPLMEIDGELSVGFDQTTLAARWGIAPVDRDLEGCAHPSATHTPASCHSESS